VTVSWNVIDNNDPKIFLDCSEENWAGNPSCSHPIWGCPETVPLYQLDYDDFAPIPGQACLQNLLRRRFVLIKGRSAASQKSRDFTGVVFVSSPLSDYLLLVKC